MLTESVRARLHDPRVRSYQLMGEELALVSGATLREAAAAYEAELARTVPERLRQPFEAAQRALLADAHGWLRRYNRNVPSRIRGYLALGRLSRFEVPWPAVAILGVSQVRSGITRSRLAGLIGAAARRVGWEVLDELASSLDDVLLRTNRAIFADSVPVHLTAMRCHTLRAHRQEELAELLLSGPAPAHMDEESRGLCRALYDALGVAGGARRFEALRAVTLRQFAREQAIFSYQMDGSLWGPSRSPLVRHAMRAVQVSAPKILRDGGARRLVFAPFPLPPTFRFEDHEARVELFGRAFVESITGSIADYRAAVEYVLDAYDPDARRVVPAFEHRNRA
jgi:hypothetical protein